MMNNDIYELNLKDTGGIYFMPPDLSYFENHFVCQREIDNWTPPPIREKRGGKRPADFISWMLRAPIVRSRVRSALSSEFPDDLEFLPFYTTRLGEDLFVMNVLNTDRSKSIFKADPYSMIYVRSRFGELAVSHRFTGLALADPSADNVSKILRGQDINMFPGIV